jgi:hypothetical protein
MKAGLAMEPIGKGQFFLMVAVSVVAGGVYIWPQTVLSKVGQGSPWSILGSVGLALAITALNTVWPPAASGKTTLGRLKGLWSGWRWPLFLAMAGLMLPLDAALVALFCQMLHMIFYPYTPRWVFATSILALVWWLAQKSLAQLARTVQFWFPLVIGSFFLLALLSLGNFRQLAALHPTAELRLIPIAQGIVTTWYLWMQGEVIVTLGGHVRATPWPRLRRLALAAVAFQGLMLFIIYALVVGTLGPEAATTLEWPMIYIFSNLTLQMVFVSRPGLLIMITWVVAIVLYASVRLFVLSVNLQEGLGLGQRGRMLVAGGLAILMGLIGWALPTPLAATNLVLHAIDPLALCLTAAITVANALRAAQLSRRRRA